MEEIFQLCDEITILRDGQWIATQPLEGLDMDKIIAMMVGRSLTQRFPEKHNTPGETILEVRNLTSLRQPSIRDVSFDLRKERSSVSPGWWERSVPILSKHFSGSAKIRRHDYAARQEDQ